MRDAVYRRSLAVADAVAVLIALYAAAAVAGSADLMPLALAAAPVIIVLAKVMGLYDHDSWRLHKDTLGELPALFQLATFFTLVAFLAQGAIFSDQLSEPAVAVLWALLFLPLVGGRAFARAAADRLTPSERCLFIGDRQLADAFSDKIEVQGLHAEVVSVLDTGAGAEMPTVDTLWEQLGPMLEALDIHRVILASGTLDGDELLHAIGDLDQSGVKVSVLPPISRIAGLSFDLDQLPGMALLGMHRFEITRSSLGIKRTFDIVTSALALAALSPLLIATAIAIRFDSRGPVLFRQGRVGRNGRQFEMLKFRSMVDGADERKHELEHLTSANGLFKLERDPRVTRIGRLLRRFSIDEMPQLVNVLRGEMSMVGPRPLIPEEDAMVEGAYRRRLNVRPGITGHWQILGSLRVPLDEMVTLDYLYVANWSLWTDLKLLFRTIPYLALRGNV